MKLLFGCFTASFILILCTNANSQNKLSGVQGQILLQDNILADITTIALIRVRDSSVISTISSQKNGSFIFESVPAGNYIIRVSHVGYQKYVSAPFTVSNTATINLPGIRLHPAVTALKGVTITNKTAYIETRPDKTILNVEKGMLAGGVSALDVLGSAPGVRVNSGGEIFLKGAQKAGIAINGRLVKLSAQDMADLLQNMSSGTISQVELINNPSAKYDAAGAGGLINIIMKKGLDDGFNGSVTPGIGQGNYFRLSSNTGLNYRSGPLNFFANANFNNYDTDHTITTNRYVGNTTRFNVNYFNRQKTYSGSYNFGADYSIDATHTLGFLVMGSFNNSFLNKNTLSAIANNQVPDSALRTLSALNKRIDNINYNLNYSGRLGHTNQTLSADADYNIYNRNSYEDLNSSLYNVHTGLTATPLYYRNEAPTHIVDVSGRVDYVNPISKTRKLEAGLKSLYAKNDNTQSFDNVIGGVHYTDPLISSEFDYKENITSGYINYIATPSAKFNYQLDLRVEHTESDANTVTEQYRIKRSYTDYFPVLMLNYHINANHRLSLNFNRRIDRPNYQELNPIIAYQDKYNFTEGNAYLRPAYQDKIELAHNYKNQFTTTLYASFTKDFYGFSYFSQNDATGTFTVGKINLKQANTFGVSFDAPVDIRSWWNVNFNVDASYQHFVDYAGLLNQTTTDAIFKLNQQLTLPGDIALNIYAQYEVPTYYAIYRYKASYYVSPGASKKLFNKRAALTLSIRDIFNTDRDRYSTDYANLNMMGYDKKETRIYSLSFTYRFGKSTVKASRRHVTGNSDDLKRVVGATN
ncbi:MAG: TonB-dependent receptor [Bacteroidota bacterium]